VGTQDERVLLVKPGDSAGQNLEQPDPHVLEPLGVSLDPWPRPASLTTTRLVLGLREAGRQGRGQTLQKDELEGLLVFSEGRSQMLQLGHLAAFHLSLQVGRFSSTKKEKKVRLDIVPDKQMFTQPLPGPGR